MGELLPITFMFTTNRTFPSSDGFVHNEEMQMQVKKTGLFEDIDFHNDNLVAELESLIASDMFTAFEMLEFAEEIVAKRKQADAGMLDLRTGLRY
jgi:hypothetical protein